MRRTTTSLVTAITVTCALALGEAKAKAESPTGWCNNDPVYQFSYVNPAMQRILFSFHDAWHPATGRTGIVVTTHRVRDDGYHVGLDVKAIPASDLIEYSNFGTSTYGKVYFRGFWDPFLDPLKEVSRAGLRTK